MRSITRGALSCALMLAAASSAYAAVETASVQFDHTDYREGYGKRDVSGVEATGRAGTSSWHVGLAHGERDYGGARYGGTRLSGSLHHTWSDALSTRTSVMYSDDNPVFVNREIAQELHLKVIPNTVLSAGGKYAEYHGSAYVSAWSVGAAYYFPRVTASYRYSKHHLSHGPGGDGSTLSLRLKDVQGKGSSQLWVGTGTSAYSAELDPLLVREHESTRVFLRRNQPLGEHLMLNVGLGKTWHKTRVDRFTSLTSHLGLGYHW
jgi:YaiO family outer membrane protein